MYIYGSIFFLPLSLSFMWKKQICDLFSGEHRNVSSQHYSKQIFLFLTRMTFQFIFSKTSTCTCKLIFLTYVHYNTINDLYIFLRKIIYLQYCKNDMIIYITYVFYKTNMYYFSTEGIKYLVFLICSNIIQNFVTFFSLSL